MDDPKSKRKQNINNANGEFAKKSICDEFLARSRRFFKKYRDIDVWLKPKSWPILALTSLFALIAAICALCLQYFTPKYFDKTRIEVTYNAVKSASLEEIESLSRNSGCGDFSKLLDDKILNEYFYFAFNVKNPTPNPIERAKFEVDCGNDNAKIIDIKYVVKNPFGKIVPFEHDLPKLTWVPPAKPTIVSFTYSQNTDSDANVYVSLFEDRGFGKVDSIRGNWGELSVAFAPRTDAFRYYVRLSLGSGAETDLSDTPILVPNLIYLVPSFKQVTEAGGPVESSIAPNLEAVGPRNLSRLATFTLLEGIDPKSDIEVYVLGKAAPKEQISPNVRMVGLPKTAFVQLNKAESIALTNTYGEPNPEKLKSMPLHIKSVVTAERIILYWAPANPEDVQGVQVYRSERRNIADNSSVGELIFDNVVSLGSFKIKSSGKLVASQTVPPNFNRYSQSPPEMPKKSEVSSTHPRPSAPKLRRVEEVEGMAYIADVPPQKDLRYTYTFYFHGGNNVVSYPITVDAGISSSPMTGEVSVVFDE